MNDVLKNIELWIKKNEDYIVKHLSNLVKIKTENIPPIGYEKKGQEYLYNLAAEFIKDEDIDLYEITDVKGIEENPLFIKNIDGVERIYKNRPNLSAKIRGTGGGKSIVFSGHIDTVPVRFKEWNIFSDPFSGIIKNGKLYGRGVADMKAGTLCGFLCLKCLKDLGLVTKGSVYAESVVDEEYGGVNGTIAARLRNPNIDFAILPEPSNLKIITSVVGGSIWKITVNEEGPGGYSQNVNPIYKLAEVIRVLKKFNEMYFHESIYPQNYPGNHDLKIHLFLVNAGGLNYLDNASYTPTEGYIYLYIPTIYTMPEEKVRKDFIEFMNENLSEIPEFKKDLPKYETVLRWLGASKTDAKHPALSILKEVYKNFGLPYMESGFSIPCDAYAFREISNTEVVVLGPKGSNYHGVDEYVEIESIFQLVKIMVLTAFKFCN